MPPDALVEAGPVGAEVAGGIQVQGLTKTYRLGETVHLALNDVTFGTPKGGFTALLGPSGCGKSSILRILADLEAPTSGVVQVHGEPPEAARRARHLGLAFQDAALLPWHTVADNIDLPLRLAGRARRDRGRDRARVMEMVELVGLTGFEHAKPGHLSGGMRQRVAIARALVVQPQVLLLDEPFGALDELTRQRLNVELRAIWAARSPTTVLVTHSVAEAAFLADRIVVMSGSPGTICAVIDSPLPFERSVDVMHSREFHELTDQISYALAGGA
jgi:NitT/TauT family transport system ATP-binding protein